MSTTVMNPYDLGGQDWLNCEHSTGVYINFVLSVQIISVIFVG